jgi:DnaK suppressor protein
MRNDIDTNYFKDKLKEELLLVEKQLEDVGEVNPDNKADWEATPKKDFDTDSADENETADKIEEFEGNAAVLSELERKFNDIKTALEKIEKGEYGFCEVCQAPIEEGRLVANQSARTCKAHMNE